MPMRNRTGPMGQGPLTGRGLGPCGQKRFFGRGFGCKWNATPEWYAKPLTKEEK